jgi:D-citramalate synthase
MQSREFHHITMRNCYINSGFNVASTARIRVDIHGQEYQGTGSGNGGFDAFMGAISSILKERDFVMPELLDFEIHIPRGGQTSALTECIITWAGEEREFKTRGVDANQVLAAVKATMRMINIRMQAEAG